MNDYFDPLRTQRNVLLTTYRRDGTPVGTAVHVVTRGDVAYVRTFDPSGKLKRIRNNPEVEVAPSTITGRPTGPALPAKARIADGPGSADIGRALAGKYRLLQGRLIPWYHRRKGLTTVHLELTPALTAPIDDDQRRPPMDPADELTRHRHRQHLLMVAYRLLGSLSAAEEPGPTPPSSSASPCPTPERPRLQASLAATNWARAVAANCSTRPGSGRSPRRNIAICSSGP